MNLGQERALVPAHLAIVSASNGERRVLEIPLDQLLRDPHQPRRTFDPEALEELVESIKSQGLQQCPLVNFAYHKNGKDYYYIKAGERRWRAHTILGRKTMLCVLSDELYDGTFDVNRRLAQAAENSSREPHTHSEIVAVLEDVLREEYVRRGESTHGAVQAALKRVAEAFGKSVKWAENYHTLTRLHVELRALLDTDDDERINFGVACALARAPEFAQKDILLRAKTVRKPGSYSHAAMYQFIVREVRLIRGDNGGRKRKPSDDRVMLVSLIETMYGKANAFCGNMTTKGLKLFVGQMTEGMKGGDVNSLLHRLREAQELYKLIESALAERQKTLTNGER
jgi:ParB/RepB/Spo0J family partition protein